MANWRSAHQFVCRFMQRPARRKALGYAFIQGYAVDRILELSEKAETPVSPDRDEFNQERRYEQRFPGMAKLLPEFLQGYEKKPRICPGNSLLSGEKFRDQPCMKQAVLEYCGQTQKP